MDPIRAANVRALFLQMRSSAVSSLIVTAYMVATAWPYTAWQIIVAWAGVQLASQVLRELLIRAWLRRAPPDSEVGRWAQNIGDACATCRDVERDARRTRTQRCRR